MDYYLATRQGLVMGIRDDQGWRSTGQGLAGHHLTSIAARSGVILAGTVDGIFASADRGSTWIERNSGLADRHIRWMAFHPEIEGCAFAGTEPAGIYVSRDNGARWRACAEVAQLRERFGWWLPYSTGAGCVRGFAFHGSRAYAAVEVGAALRSDDSGTSWRLAAGSDGLPRFRQPQEGWLHPDVHSVAVHPVSPDRVYAPTGGGFYASGDGGDTWQALYLNCYARAVWLDPDDPDHIILGPSDGPSGRNGRIEESDDGGRTWRTVAGPWNENMVERFTQLGTSLFAVMANGELLRAAVASADWQPALPDVEGVNAVTAMF